MEIGSVWYYLLIGVSSFIVLFITKINEKSQHPFVVASIVTSLLILLTSQFSNYLGTGTLAKPISNTAYIAKNVIGINNGKMIIYASVDGDDNSYYYEIECSRLLGGCLDAKSWPKKFKLIQDGDKKVIIELKNMPIKKASK